VRVLLSCLQSKVQHPIPAYSFWKTYLKEGLREAGVEVMEVPEVDWAEGLIHKDGTKKLEAWRSRTWEITLQFARKHQKIAAIDFFLGYLYPSQVDVSAIRALQKLGVLCVNFFCDNVREFRKVPEAYAPFDLHWVPEYEALAMYQGAGLPHIHAPMPCWIPLHLRNVAKYETEPATFIGSADILRMGLLGEAITHGAELTLRGPGWGEPCKKSSASKSHAKSDSFLANQFALLRKHGLGAVVAKIANAIHPMRSQTISRNHFAPAVYGDEYFRVTREAMVTVGVNRVPVTRRPLCSPLRYSRLRDIEAPMLGACYLTEHTEGLTKLYNLGEEIETYKSAEEMANKLKVLFGNPQKRASLRMAGQKRALSEHSVAASVRKIYERLGISSRTKTSSPVYTELS